MYEALHHCNLISLPDIDVTCTRENFSAFRWQHFRTEGYFLVEQEYLKSPAFATFFVESNPFLVSRTKLHRKGFSVYDAIHFEPFHRLHSCLAVTDNSGRLCQSRGQDHVTLIRRYIFSR